MIDILKKIEKLRLEHNWSLYKLAEEAGLTQSTITNMFSRGTLPSIRTLDAICSAFNISLSEFFSEEDNINYKTLSMLDSYNRLDDKDKKIIDKLIKYMLEK